MTPDEEIISDYERNLRDVREGIREGLFLIVSLVVFVGFCWVVFG